jgi:hypothetical protein
VSRSVIYEGMRKQTQTNNEKKGIKKKKKKIKINIFLIQLAMCESSIHCSVSYKTRVVFSPFYFPY